MLPRVAQLVDVGAHRLSGTGISAMRVLDCIRVRSTIANQTMDISARFLGSLEAFRLPKHKIGLYLPSNCEEDYLHSGRPTVDDKAQPAAKTLETGRMLPT